MRSDQLKDYPWEKLPSYLYVEDLDIEIRASGAKQWMSPMGSLQVEVAAPYLTYVYVKEIINSFRGTL